MTPKWQDEVTMLVKKFWSSRFYPKFKISMRYLLQMPSAYFIYKFSQFWSSYILQTNPAVSSFGLPVYDFQASSISVKCRYGLKDTIARHEGLNIIAETIDSSDKSKSRVHILNVVKSTSAPRNESENDAEGLLPLKKASSSETFVPNSLCALRYRSLR